MNDDLLFQIHDNAMTDEGPIARKSDKETSQQSAIEIAPQLNGKRKEFFDRLKAIGEATANEVARGNETLRKRAKELVRVGAIVECGTRKCKVTGKNATVYKVK